MATAMTMAELAAAIIVGRKQGNLDRESMALFILTALEKSEYLQILVDRLVLSGSEGAGHLAVMAAFRPVLWETMKEWDLYASLHKTDGHKGDGSTKEPNQN